MFNIYFTPLKIWSVKITHHIIQVKIFILPYSLPYPILYGLDDEPSPVPTIFRTLESR